MNLQAIYEENGSDQIGADYYIANALVAMERNDYPKAYRDFSSYLANPSVQGERYNVAWGTAKLIEITVKTERYSKSCDLLDDYYSLETTKFSSDMPSRKYVDWVKQIHC